ncbi:uncharacterized protein [Choristoneura fumiferana]|uniref:uncharacterized protein n=1 Tax=Choristoneura fumiferana TaxID=7141 RepID=UPI003D153A51
MGPYVPDNRWISFPESNPLLYQLSPKTVKVPQKLPEQRNVRQLQPSPPRVQMDTSSVSKNINAEINEVIEALNQLTESRAGDHQESRAAERDDYGNPYSRPLVYDNPSSAHNGPLVPEKYPPGQQEQEYASQPKLSLLKSDLLAKPVASRAAFKVGGLIELVLGLLSGSGSGGLELTGFKDIVINGIIKPLLTAKGGLKAVLSKLSIPMIALMLINLEVLITMWWLWEEDCPQSVYHKSAYHQPNHSYPVTPTKPVYQAPTYSPSYNYNTY